MFYSVFCLLSHFLFLLFSFLFSLRCSLFLSLKSTALSALLFLFDRRQPNLWRCELRTASFWWVGGCGFAVCNCGGVGLCFGWVVVRWLWVCVCGLVVVRWPWVLGFGDEGFLVLGMGCAIYLGCW